MAVLLVAAHRLVVDAWSFTTIVNDLLEILEGNWRRIERLATPEAGHSYAGFVAWERDYLVGDAAQKDLKFWDEYLADAPTTLRLPTTGTYPAEPSLSVRSLAFQLDGQLVQKLLTMSAEQDVPLAATMLSAYQLLLHRTCHQADLLVACESRGASDGRIAGCLRRAEPVCSAEEQYYGTTQLPRYPAAE